jgi:periplasmic copper chaperone A
MRYSAFLTLIVGICLSIAAQPRAQTSTTNPISIEHPWARATPVDAKTGATYLTIINQGSAGDRLVGASTPVAAKVQFHQETSEGGVMRMRELPSVEVGPGATVTFKPGSMHMMTTGLKQPLKEGQSFPLTLEFEKAGKINLEVPILKAGAMGLHDMHGM